MSEYQEYVIDTGKRKIGRSSIVKLFNAGWFKERLNISQSKCESVYFIDLTPLGMAMAMGCHCLNTSETEEVYGNKIRYYYGFEE